LEYPYAALGRGRAPEVMPQQSKLNSNLVVYGVDLNKDSISATNTGGKCSGTNVIA